MAGVRHGVAQRMIICHCNRLCERDLRQHVDPTCRRVSRLYARLGARPKCKQCLPFAHKLLSEEISQRTDA
jgi:bacterioferritin-associated ferredoxin